MDSSTDKKYYAFTLIEILVVVGLIAILAAITIVALNPTKMFAKSRNTERRNGIRAIHNAMEQWQVDGNGVNTITEGDGSAIADCNVTSTVIMDTSTIANGEVDLDGYLVGVGHDYLAAIPRDPSEASGDYTGYTICSTTNPTRFIINAPGAELAELISIPSVYDPLTHGLIGYWTMDEVALNSCSGGEDTCDTSGNDYHGVWEASLTVANIISGKYNKAVLFDGNNDYISFGDVDLTTDITISAWIDPTVLAVDEGCILSKWGNDNGRWVFDTTTNGGLFFSQANAAGPPGCAGTICTKTTYGNLISTDGGWYHVAVTFDSTSYDTDIFIDGVRQNFFLNEPISIPLSTGNDMMRVGRRADNHDEYNGKIDDLRVYSRILLDSEIERLATEAP